MFTLKCRLLKFGISELLSNNCLFPTVDGQWTTWSEWSECSATCGNATKTRYRECEGQLSGGKDCEGVARETMTCIAVACSGEIVHSCSFFAHALLLTMPELAWFLQLQVQVFKG